MTITSRAHDFFSTIRVRRLLLYGSLGILAALLILVALIAALPTLVSTRAGQNLARQSLTWSLKRQVAWADLTLSWSQGLEIRGLTLGMGAAPLLQAQVGDLLLVPKVSYRDGRPRIDLSLRVHSVAAELAPGPPQPLKPQKPYREPLGALADALQQFEGLDWKLPIDLGVQLAVDPVRLAYRDPKSGQEVTLSNGSLNLDLPSLADQPIALDLRGDLDLAGHRLEALSLKGDLKHLVSTSRHLHPAAALLALHAALPGSSLFVQGGLQEPGGISARARLDLSRVMALAGPFLPAGLPSVSGEMTLFLQAKADAAHNLQADLDLAGSRIALAGGRMKRGRIGPLEMRVRQRIVSDRQRQQVRFTGGSARIGSLIEAGWEAVVDRPSGEDRDLTARLGPVRIDLRQLLAGAGPFLPSPFPVTEAAGELSLKELLVHLHGRKNQGDLALSGLGVQLPRLRLALAQGRLAADGVEVALDKATIPLSALQPARVDAALSYGVRRLALTGAQPVVADGLRGALRLSLSDMKKATHLPTRIDAALDYTLRRLALSGSQPMGVDGVHGALQLTLKDLNLKSPSPRKVSASGELKQSLDLRRVSLDRKLSADNLNQQLVAHFLAKDSGEVELTLPLFKLSAAALQGRASGKDLKPVSLTADLSATGIRLPAGKGAAPSLERVSCTAAVGDFLKLALSGGVSGAPTQLASSDGSLQLDLGRLLPVAAALLPKGVAADGVSTLSWKLALPVGQKPQPGEKNPLRAIKASLAQIERADISLNLANRGIAYPLAGGTVKLSELRSAQPLRLLLPGKGKNLTLQGSVEFAGLRGLPGSAASLPAQTGSFTLDGELAHWQSLRVHQELKLQQFGVVQRSDASIGRIDALLERPEAISPASLLQRLDATVTSELAAHFPATPTPVPGGVRLSGDCTAGLRLDLTAGHDLRLRASAVTRDFGVQLPDGSAAQGVFADLAVDRSYALSRGEPVGWTPLSSSLVRPGPEPFGDQGAAELVNRVREDLRGEVRGSRRFTIRRVVSGAGKEAGTPIELTSLEGDLLLTPGSIGLSFLQAETLGGTVRVRGLIDLRPEVPAVSAACSFSNLETYLLLPRESREQARKSGRDTAITGEVSLDAPLLTGERDLLEGIRMQLNLRKIGADTLERALFGLDPYERNEQIVAQRKLLRQGTLKRLRAGTLDGSFSFDGDVLVRGVNVTLPKVERIRLSELPIRKELARAVAAVASARKMLDLIRADTLNIDPKGGISLGRRGHE
jgi:translocation and assembly module TamB